MDYTTQATRQPSAGLTAIISAVLLTFFLFFIDEGYYDLRWMAEWSNWVFFLIYTFVLAFCQWIVAWLIAKFLQMLNWSLPSFLLQALVIIIGIGLGLFLCFWAFS